MPKGPLQMSGRQRALYEALLENDGRLANMYLGALKVSIDGSNPDHFSLGAHGIRELMEKIPAYLDLKVNNPYPTESLKAKVYELEKEWDKIKKYITQGGMLNSSKQPSALRKFLKKCVEFFCWCQEFHPKRKEEIAGVLRSLDPKGKPLPHPIEKLRVDEWDKIRDYFIDVAHHRIQVIQNDFDSWLEALETFLLDRFHPRTFKDHALIDSIIREGERNA